MGNEIRLPNYELGQVNVRSTDSGRTPRQARLICNGPEKDLFVVAMVDRLFTVAEENRV